MIASKTAQRIRLCPQCHSQRPLAEMICGNNTDDGQCGHPMTSVQPSHSSDFKKETFPINPEEISDQEAFSEQGSSEAEEIKVELCSNGHEVDTDDEECLICGAPICQENFDEPTERLVLPQWQVISEAPFVAGAEQRVVARHIKDGHKAIVTIFREGAEPDQSVYEILRTIDLDHIARLEETGRHQGRPYEITEYIPHGTLRDFQLDPSDIPTIKRIVEEISRALLDFNRVGLRHRDLTPNVVTIRTLQPLDLVIEGFGSSCLSEYDLDVVSPLENTIYMAPEAIAGGVAASSDWWSLGIILLEKLAPDYFKDVNPKAFLINALTAGVEIPNSIDPVLKNLLSGLLLRSREHRFGFDQVRSWLGGEVVPVAAELFPEDFSGPKITLGDQEIYSLQRYALTAAEEYFWDEAKAHLSSGRLATWAEQSGLDPKSLVQLRATGMRDINQNFKLGIALKILNKNMPFVQVGEIVGPGWLLKNPELGYELISSETSNLLEDLDMEPWIIRLKERANAVRHIAKANGVELDEDTAKINLLSTSRARLLVNWEQRRSLFPDTDNLALVSILDKKKLAEEDLIVLLSADIGQFQSTDDIISKATILADTAELAEFRPETARKLLATKSRQEIFRSITDRTTNFARCGNEKVDNWVDDFRLERRTTLPQALVMLEFEKEKWKQSADQIYVSDIIKFFETKVHTQINQGPLARMRISKTSPRIDLFELNDETEPAEAILNTILDRTGTKVDIGNRTVMADELLPSRIRKLVRNSTLYHRETGINGLQLGFPFVVIDTGKKGDQTAYRTNFALASQNDRHGRLQRFFLEF
ncbi:MAG TPA: hypothetical protein DCL66_14415 [Gammaproteobacteria bacterium]|nr:hypothetical protein [Gammaproteobacteria bacterium]